MLIVLGRLHTMLISKSTYSKCAVLHVLTMCKKFSEMCVYDDGIAELNLSERVQFLKEISSHLCHNE